MNNTENKRDVFQLKRYFAIAGLSGTIIAAILLVLLFRHMAINDIVILGERNNVVLAKTVLNSVKADLVNYLMTTKDNNNNSPENYNLPLKLDKAIQMIMADSTVIRLKIYNQHGIVVFSTKPDQIGKDQNNHLQFKSAMGGQITSKLIFHDTFNIFQKRLEEDNLVQSYLPIRLSATSPVHGVFEIYTDVRSIVSLVERTEVIVFLGVIIILVLLYSFLNLIIHRAASTIAEQQFIIHERTKSLELLSAQMLNTQEAEKKNIAYKLHEEIAQTLAAVKNNIESASAKDINKQSDDTDPVSHRTIETLHGVIQEVRALAMELRPPSLDDFGLVKAIGWLCKEYHSLYPDLNFKVSFNLDESKLPKSLKTLIYRVAQEALGSIARTGEADVVALSLSKNGETITLSIEDNALAYHPSKKSPDNDSISTIALAAMKERTLMSGGAFSIDSNQQGGTIAISSWTY